MRQFCWKLRWPSVIGSSAVVCCNFLYAYGEQWLGTQRSSNGLLLVRKHVSVTTPFFAALGRRLAKELTLREEVSENLPYNIATS
jgi:hypothetical protein